STIASQRIKRTSISSEPPEQENHTFKRARE
ncbi:unnamed protein product, partial [marine sediment metagenome]